MIGCRRSSWFVASSLAIVFLAGQAVAQPTGTPPPLLPAPGPSGGPTPSVAPPPGPVVPQPAGQPGAPPMAFDAPPPPVPPPFPGMPQRFNFRIDPKTPTKDLLPVSPSSSNTGPVLTDELTKVPEVEFQAKPAKVTTDGKLVEQAAYQLAKINHMNAKKTDAFMTALLENRSDLAGLPFIMGDDCRTTGERVKYFTQAAETVRRALAPAQTVVPFTARTSLAQPVPTPAVQGVVQANTGGSTVTLTDLTIVSAGGQQSFWQQYATFCEQEDAARTRPDKKITEMVTLARIAALTQMLAAESAEIRLGLVKYLTATPHVEATKALARMAIFSAEDDLRAAAIAALKVRREKDYTDILVAGLRYPWPAVAKRSADAIVKLERTDMIPALLNVLDSTDPRMPTKKEVNGKSLVVVREIVKLNHHRNCMMCHTPVGSGNPNPNAISAEVAVPGQPLPTPAEGYRQSTVELMIRVDVTYLRPDFSASLPVKDAHPWPEMQRFDFLVRERVLKTDEATAYRDELTPKEAGVLSPYHRAAVSALRELTGKDAAPTAEAWRKLLGIKAELGVIRD